MRSRYLILPLLAVAACSSKRVYEEPVLEPGDRVPSAERAIDDMMIGKRFGAAGGRVVVEAYLEGEEVSVHAICAGGRALLLPSSQDHKRAFDNDAGPNTGGMGAIAPVPWIGDDELKRVRSEIIQPVLDGMQSEGTPFTGTLYAGLMWTRSGPKVLEFNTRFGDPETEVLMPLAGDDIVDLFAAAAADELPAGAWTSDGAAATIVLASGGYPDSYPTGLAIDGLEGDVPDTMVFHAGTRHDDGRVVTAGGRVLAVTGWAGSLRGALDAAYRRARTIRFDGAFMRSDIGRRHLDNSGSEIKKG
jgi:phosphoribosylamine--glycine ligase